MRALIIDDDALSRRVLEGMFAGAGLTIDEADSVVSAMRLIDEHDYVLIMIDLRMPNMDGFEGVRLIRGRNDRNGCAVIVVVTADDAEWLELRCLEVGADAVIRKPVEINQLFETVGRLLAALPGASV